MDHLPAVTERPALGNQCEIEQAADRLGRLRRHERVVVPERAREFPDVTEQVAGAERAVALLDTRVVDRERSLLARHVVEKGVEARLGAEVPRPREIVLVLVGPLTAHGAFPFVFRRQLGTAPLGERQDLTGRHIAHGIARELLGAQLESGERLFRRHGEGVRGRLAHVHELAAYAQARQLAPAVPVLRNAVLVEHELEPFGQVDAAHRLLVEGVGVLERPLGVPVGLDLLDLLLEFLGLLDRLLEFLGVGLLDRLLDRLGVQSVDRSPFAGHGVPAEQHVLLRQRLEGVQSGALVLDPELAVEVELPLRVGDFVLAEVVARDLERRQAAPDVVDQCGLEL